MLKLMLNYVHQLVANLACRLFVAQLVAYSRFLEIFLKKSLPAAA